MFNSELHVAYTHKTTNLNRVDSQVFRSSSIRRISSHFFNHSRTSKNKNNSSKEAVEQRSDADVESPLEPCRPAVNAYVVDPIGSNSKYENRECLKHSWKEKKTLNLLIFEQFHTSKSLKYDNEQKFIKFTITSSFAKARYS